LTVSHECLFEISDKDVKGIISVSMIMKSKVTKRNFQHSETGKKQDKTRQTAIGKLEREFSRQSWRPHK